MLARSRNHLLILCGILALSFGMSHAQNVGINNPVPAASALLDLTSTDKGLLVPRVALAAANVAAPVASPAISLLVYNTATAGTAPNQVSPGFYYWSGSKWIRFGESGEGWSTTGNAGTIYTTHFLGTTDPSDFEIRVNNQHSGVLQGSPNGETHFGFRAGFNSGFYNQNTFIGNRAGEFANGGGQNVFMGTEAGKNNAGSGNVSIGYRADTANNSYRNYATAVGYQAGMDNMAWGVSFFGAEAGLNNWMNTGNSYFGYRAGRYLDGRDNALFGDSVLMSPGLNGGENAVFGSKAGYMFSGQPSGNAVFGHRAAVNLYNPVSNAVFGNRAAQSYAAGNYNAIFGAEAGGGHSWGLVVCESNALFGYRAGYDLEKGGHSIFGTEAGRYSQAGSSNSYFGLRSGYWNLAGSDNAFFGDSAGFTLGYSYQAANSSRNALFGAKVGSNLDGGKENVMMGYKSGFGLYGGDFNTLVGTETGLQGVYYNYVTAIGYRAGYSNASYHNTFVGAEAGYNNDQGISNTAVGFRAGYSNSDDYNTFVGDSAGSTLSNGSRNAALGAGAGGNVTAGNDNVSIGYRSMGSATFAARTGVTAVGSSTAETVAGGLGEASLFGYRSGYYGSGLNNSFFGSRSGESFLLADDNVSVGYRAGQYINQSSDNVIVGASAAMSLSQSDENVVIGAGAAASVAGIQHNVIIGANAAGIMNSGADNNVAVGHGAGWSMVGDYNTVLGQAAGSNNSQGTAVGNGATANGLNSTAIGSRAWAQTDNSLVLGSINGTNGASVTVNVGIGTPSPTQRLDVVGSIRMADGNQAAGRVLACDANGTGSWQDPALLGSGWGLAGNSGTNTTTNFIGTTDNNGFAFRTNNTERMRILNTGLVGIGIGVPTRKLHVVDGGLSGGVPFANSMVVFEDNASTYLHMLTPTASESGILFGSAALSIRSGIVAYNGNGLHFRTGGNNTRVTITDIGRVGIGTTAPTSTLDVRGNAVFNEAAGNFDFRVESMGNANMLIVDASTNNVLIGTNNFSTKLLRVGNTTGAGIQLGSFESFADGGTNLMQVNTNFVPDVDNNWDLGSSVYRWNQVWAAVGVIQTSDRRDKTHIRNLDYGLAEVMKLRPVRFVWKDQPHLGDRIGLIAQEVQPVIGEVVQTRDWVHPEEGSDKIVEKELERYGVYYSDLIPVLVKAIQEQQREITDLKKKIETLGSE